MHKIRRFVPSLGILGFVICTCTAKSKSQVLLDQGSVLENVEGQEEEKGRCKSIREKKRRSQRKIVILFTALLGGSVLTMTPRPAPTRESGRAPTPCQTDHWVEDTPDQDRRSTVSDKRSESSSKAPFVEKKMKTAPLQKISDLSSASTVSDQDFNVQGSSNGKERLYRAVKTNDVQEIERLLASGVSIKERDEKGQTPLHWAVDQYSPDRKTITVLLRHKEVEVNGIDKEGRTALLLAAERYSRTYHKIGAIDALLEDERIQINGTNREGYTALQLAVKHYDPHVPFIQKLLQHRKIKVNAEVKEGVDRGKTALDLILENNYGKREGKSNCVEAVKLLLANGADVERIYGFGGTAFHWAVNLCSLDPIRALLAYIDVNITDKQGNTPLHWFVIGAGTKQRVMELLLGHEKIEVNKQNNKGQTALHLALRRPIPNMELVKRLLEHKDTKVNIADNKKETASMLAKRRKLDGGLLAFFEKRSKREGEQQ